MEDFVEVELEGYRVKAIKQYDTYLRGIYGDYMQFPPKEKQKSHHSYTVYWKK
jgi:lipopolysaccharide cholinephosphotransferase